MEHISQLYIDVTAAIFDARQRGDLARVAEILDPFGQDARRALLIGSSALLALAPGEYRDALKKAMAATLYSAMQERGSK